MTKHQAPTLADDLLRATFTKEYRDADPKANIRHVLLSARRFILDDSMAEFMADLAYSFIGEVGQINAEHQRPIKRGTSIIKSLEQLRHSARLPHKTMWIEYNMHARIKRSNAVWNTIYEPKNFPERVGYLLETNPYHDTIFRATEVMPMKGAPYIYTAPLAAGWYVTDKLENHPPVNWLSIMPPEYDTAGLLTGIYPYAVDGVALLAGLFSYEFTARCIKQLTDDLLDDYNSMLRYLWVFLSCLNDVPCVIKDVTPSKGFVARGAYRKFLNHTTITLTVPQVERCQLAHRIVTIVRRRAHEVRGFFRVYEREPSCRTILDKYRDEWINNDPHSWMPVDDDAVHLQCADCPSFKTWIHEHQRGDASLGFVTHTYKVTHGDEHGPDRH